MYSEDEAMEAHEIVFAIRRFRKAATMRLLELVETESTAHLGDDLKSLYARHCPNVDFNLTGEHIESMVDCLSVGDTVEDKQYALKQAIAEDVFYKFIMHNESVLEDYLDAESREDDRQLMADFRASVL